MPDKLKILPQELRENADPEEAIRPMPWLAAVTLLFLATTTTPRMVLTSATTCTWLT